MNNLTDMDNLSTNGAARKLELALISFLDARHNGTDVGVLCIHFLSALIIFFRVTFVLHNTTWSRVTLWVI